MLARTAFATAMLAATLSAGAFIIQSSHAHGNAPGILCCGDPPPCPPMCPPGPPPGKGM